MKSNSPESERIPTEKEQTDHTCGRVSLSSGNINVRYYDFHLSDDGHYYGGYFCLQTVTSLGHFDVVGLSADELMALSIMFAAAADRASDITD